MRTVESSIVASSRSTSSPDSPRFCHVFVVSAALAYEVTFDGLDSDELPAFGFSDG